MIELADKYHVSQFVVGMPGLDEVSINVNSWSGDSRYFAFVSYDIDITDI